MAQEHLQEDERRHSTPNSHLLWSHLNTSQQAAVSSLSHFGYELTYIRLYPSGDIAILKLDEQVATVDEEGNIDPDPNIKIRG